MSVKLLAMIISILIFFFVIELIRRQKMTFKYSLFWLSGCILVLVFSPHEHLLAQISQSAGFELLSNFLFFFLLVFFILLSLLLTIYINEQNNRSEQLAQAVGILEYQLKKLREKMGEGK